MEVGNKMKIIVDEIPKTLHECCFYSWIDKKCLLSDDWRFPCVHDDSSNIIRPCDIFIELSEIVGNAVKGFLRKQGE